MVTETITPKGPPQEACFPEKVRKRPIDSLAKDAPGLLASSSRSYRTVQYYRLYPCFFIRWV